MTLLAICFLCGLLLGGVSLLTLHRNVERFVRGEGAVRAMAIQLLRLAVLAAILAGFARLGAGPLLMVAAGLLIARTWLLSRQVRA